MKKQLEVRIETINTLIATFGDEDGKLAKELNEVYKKLNYSEEEEQMEKRYLVTLKIEGLDFVEKKVTLQELIEIEENEMHNEIEIVKIVDLVGIA